MRKLHLRAAGIAYSVALAALLSACTGSTYLESSAEAFVLVDAKRVGRRIEEPTWVGLQGEAEEDKPHFQTGNAVYALAPGTYTLDHIDFTVSRGGDARTFGIGGDLRFEFEVQEGAITMVGLVVLEERQNRQPDESAFELKLVRGKEIIARACASNYDLFAKYPVQLVSADGSTRRVRIKCKR